MAVPCVGFHRNATSNDTASTLYSVLTMVKARVRTRVLYRTNVSQRSADNADGLERGASRCARVTVRALFIDRERKRGLEICDRRDE